MSNHLEWGHVSTALYGYVHAKDAVEVLGEELESSPVALYVTTGDGAMNRKVAASKPAKVVR